MKWNEIIGQNLSKILVFDFPGQNSLTILVFKGENLSKLGFFSLTGQNLAGFR